MKMLVTTTESIGYEIKEYLGIVSAHCVLGTNMFSDFSASISDSFGGESDTYSRKLNQINDVVLNRIKRKAAIIGADAVIGIRLDFSEISGKGKGMLMASASGTAIRIEKSVTKKDIEFGKQVPRDVITNEIKSNGLLEKLEIGLDSITEEEWRIIIDNKNDRFTHRLYESIVSNLKSSSLSKEVINQIKRYIEETLEKDSFAELLYDEFEKKRISECLIFSLIETFDLTYPELFLRKISNIEDYKNLLKIIANNDKDYYEKTDMIALEQILNHVDENKAPGEIKISKSIFGKESQYYVCPNGHKLKDENAFCDDLSCKQNRFGFTVKDLEMIKVIKTKIEILERAFA